MSKQSNIQILVACHKPSELPDNPLFLPVHVGAKLSSANLGIQRDDQGTNISEKNPNYCELTAIYWAWKNLDADYYGLFHYRRFYSFSDDTFDTGDDGHMMVRVPSLSSDVFKKYGLLDEDGMRARIEPYDLVVHESRDVRKLPTPKDKYSKTLDEHYRLHDGTITLNSDIDAMMAVIDTSFASYAESARAYMQGNAYLGYNMFIMKKELFHEMNTFVFGVLERVDPQLDLTQRSQNGRRIHGYLAELLTSMFIYHVRTTRPELRVGERQMIFAERTDPIVALQPIPDAVAVVFDLASNGSSLTPLLFTPVFQSFLKTLDKTKTYDVLIVHTELSALLKQAITQQASAFKGVTVRFLDYSVITDVLSEKGMTTKAPFTLTAPWVLDAYDRIISIQSNTTICGDVAVSSKEKTSQAWGLAASRDVYYYGLVNEQDSSVKKRAAKIGFDPYAAVDDTVLITDLAVRRKKESLDDVLQFIQTNPSLSSNELLNVRYADIHVLGQEWAHRYATDPHMEYIITLAPQEVFLEHKQSAATHIIGHFATDSPLRPIQGAAMLQYWNKAVGLSTYPLLLQTYIEEQTIAQPKSLKDALFPKGSYRRAVAKKIAPKGSPQRRVLKAVKKTIRR